jgi:putative hydroxymethylpyrimidine transport system substrate-binding protein
MRAIFGGLAIGLVALLLSGCGSGQTETSLEPPFALRDVKMTTDGYFGPQNVAVSMAAQQGYFNDAGLLVSANSPVLPTRPIPYVVTGTDEVGISHQPEVELAQAKGLPITIVGTLVSRPTTAMIWLKRSRIGGIADLKGKTIGIPGLVFQERFLNRILARSGLAPHDVKIAKVGYELVPDLVDGRVDAIFGGYSNVEGVNLEARGLDPVVTGVASLGIPAYDELVVVARTDQVEAQPQLFRDLISALARGNAAAVNEPGAAVEAIEASIAPETETSRRVLKAEVAATVPLLAQGDLSPP